MLVALAIYTMAGWKLKTSNAYYSPNERETGAGMKKEIKMNRYSRIANNKYIKYK